MKYYYYIVMQSKDRKSFATLCGDFKTKKQAAAMLQTVENACWQHYPQEIFDNTICVARFNAIQPKTVFTLLDGKLVS